MCICNFSVFFLNRFRLGFGSSSSLSPRAIGVYTSQFNVHLIVVVFFAASHTFYCLPMHFSIDNLRKCYIFTQFFVSFPFDALSANDESSIRNVYIPIHITQHRQRDPNIFKKKNTTQEILVLCEHILDMLYIDRMYIYTEELCASFKAKS